jgi:4a-hydroxytetrahydrobiopterin dehydratase
MTQQACDLTKKHCVPCEGGVPPLSKEAIDRHLTSLKHWKLNEEHTIITRVLNFKNFHETMAFVNAIAWISHQENHHPDLEVGYNRCVVHYMTHAVKGLTENDFICAAKVDALF